MIATYALLAGIGLIWGLSFTLARIVMEAGAHPLSVAFWQAAGGAAILLALGRRPPLDRSRFGFMATTGLLGTAAPSVLIFLAAERTTAGAMAVAMATSPMLCFALCAALRVDRVDGRRAGGVALGLAAVWVIASPAGGGGALGLALAMGAAASYASEDVYLALRRPREIGAFDLLTGMQAAAAIILAPGLALSGDPFPVSAPFDRADAAFFLMMAGNIAAYGGFVALIDRAGPIFASQVAYVVTAAGVFWGVAVLGEVHPAGFWVGLAMMLAGLAFAKPRRRVEPGG